VTKAAAKKVSSGNPLAAAQAAFAGGRREEALQALLEAWRATRAPEVAALVERLGAQLAPTGVQPWSDQKAKQKERVAAWIEAAQAQRPAILSSLLANLIDGKSGEALQRLEGLAGWDADPRVASTLAALVEKPPFQAGSTRPFWTRAFQTLREHADPRARDRLAAMDGKFLATLGGAASMAAVLESMTRRTVADLDEQLPSLTRALDDTERAAVATLDAALAAAAPVAPKSRAAATTEELLAAVYANPDDDGARQVLADALQEIGDPRGEFIALQLSGADPKREKALYKKHAKEWLGAAGKILKQDSIVFERGFLTAGVMHPRSNGDARNAVGAPEWATVRRLRVNDGVPVFPPLELETHPVLRGLRAFEGCSLAGGAAIATDSVARPLEVLTLARRWNDGIGNNQPLPADLQRALADAPALPRLRLLGFDGPVAMATLESLPDWASFARLEELRLYGAPSVAALPMLRKRRGPRLQRIAVGMTATWLVLDGPELDRATLALAPRYQWQHVGYGASQSFDGLRALPLAQLRLPPEAEGDAKLLAAAKQLGADTITFDAPTVGADD